MEDWGAPFNDALVKAGFVDRKVDGICILNEIARFDIITGHNELVFTHEGTFLASYAWAKHPDQPYRIEYLWLDEGDKKTPHREVGQGILHGSFKLSSWTEYHAALKMLDSHYPMTMHFVSNYGCFAYFRIPGTNAFLKPRINLRD